MKHPPASLVALSLLLIVLAASASATAQSWIALPPPATGADLYGIHFFSRDSGFVCGRRGTSTGILYRTVDRGAHWERVTLPGTPAGLNDIRFLPGSDFGAVAGDGGYVATTTDRGRTWIDRSVPGTTWVRGADIQGVRFLTPVIGFVVGRAATGNGPRLARTDDGGATWRALPIDDPPQNNLYDLDFFDELHGLAVGTGNPPRRALTSDGGATWERLATLSIPGESPESKSMYGIDAIAGTTTAYAVGGKNFGPVSERYAEVRRTTDRGRTWSATRMSNDPIAFNNPASSVFALSERVLYVSAQNAHLYLSTDAGASWRRITLPAAITAGRDLRKFSHAPDQTLFLVGSGGTILSTELIPDAAFSVDSLSFGTICAGAEASASITIANVGSGLLSVDSISIVDRSDSSVRFDVIPPMEPIAEGSAILLQVQAVASADAPAGIYRATVRLRTSDENGFGEDTIRKIPLSVMVGSGALSLHPARSRDAGSVRFGGAYSRRLLLNEIVRNVGACDMTISSATLTDGSEFSLETFSTGLLRPDQALSISLLFTPLSGCTRYDTLLIHSDDPASPLQVPLTGRGIEPSLRFSPRDTIDLGNVAVGEQGSDTLHLFNDAPDRCLDSTHITRLLWSGADASAFRSSRSIPPQETIPPGGSLSIPITATPSRAGVSTALLMIASDAGGHDTLWLRVTGLHPEMIIGDEEIVWQKAAIGERSDSLLTGFVRNVGNMEAVLLSARITGPDSTSFLYIGPEPGFRVATGSSIDLSLGFKPIRAGNHSALLILRLQYDNGRTDELKLPLRGYAVGPQIAVRRHEIDFDTTRVDHCQDSLLPQFFYNDGEALLRIDSMAIQSTPFGLPDDSHAFRLAWPMPPLVVQPGDSIPLSLSFCPTRSGSFLARLLVFNNNFSNDSLLSIVLRGTGWRQTQPERRIEFGPGHGTTELDFGRVENGTTRDSFFTIINRSTIPLEIDEIASADGTGFHCATLSGAIVLQPGDSHTVTVRFAADEQVGYRRSRVRIRFGSNIDTSFGLRGSVIRDNLTAREAAVDLGPHVIGEVFDTTIHLSNLSGQFFPDPQLLAGSRIDEVRVDPQDGSFAVTSHPDAIAPGGIDSIGLRFTATGAAGPRSSLLTICHNRRGAGSSIRRDSIVVGLNAMVIDRERTVELDLGDDRQGSPGSRIHLPIHLSGALDGAGVDTLTLLLRFNPRLLKPGNPVPRQPGVKALLSVDPLRFPNGDGRLVILSTDDQLASGVAADLDFTMLLGDTLRSTISIEGAEGNGLQFQPDSITITSDFCESDRRGVRIGAGRIVKISPHPVRDRMVIDFSSAVTGTTSMSLFDRLGEVVLLPFEQELPPGASTLEIDTSGFPAGMYFVVLRLGKIYQTVPMEVAR